MLKYPFIKNMWISMCPCTMSVLVFFSEGIFWHAVYHRYCTDTSTGYTKHGVNQTCFWKKSISVPLLSYQQKKKKNRKTTKYNLDVVAGTVTSKTVTLRTVDAFGAF